MGLKQSQPQIARYVWCVWWPVPLNPWRALLRPLLWSSVGIVPTYLPQAPQAPVRVFWRDSWLKPRMNETVATEDIRGGPPMIKWRGDWRSLYTVMIVDTRHPCVQAAWL